MIIKQYEANAKDYNELEKAYRLSSELSPYEISYKDVFPSIESIYEEYVVGMLDKLMLKSDDEIAEELKRIRKLNLPSIEDGFHATDYQLLSLPEAMNHLIDNCFAFCIKGELYNPPIEEVW